MNWADFFDKTLAASTAENWSQLAPMLGISDGAISHYRTGKRVPQVWVVADALKVQGHPTPEKAAIEIMKTAALTSTERNFFKRLAATAALLLVLIMPTVQETAYAREQIAQETHSSAMLNSNAEYTLCEMAKRLARSLLRWNRAQ